MPATSAESDALSKDLKKRGFRFVGSTIIYAHMQATGMVNDHLTGCFRHKRVQGAGETDSRAEAPDLILGRASSTRTFAPPLSVRRQCRMSFAQRCSRSRPSNFHGGFAITSPEPFSPSGESAGRTVSSSSSSLRKPEACSAACNR